MPSTCCLKAEMPDIFRDVAACRSPSRTVLRHLTVKDTAWRMRYPALILVLAALTGTAVQAQSYDCAGDAPDWKLQFDQVQARFLFPSVTEMDVMQTNSAEGRDWPQAFTLIGDRDTAIVLLEQEACRADHPFRGHVLTQRGQTPILLTGCCRLAE